MDTFKVGDLAVVLRATDFPEFVGLTCEITGFVTDGAYQGQLYVNLPGHKATSSRGYCAKPSELRKIPPDESKGSWADIAEFTGWTPERVKVEIDWTPAPPPFERDPL